MLFKLNPSAGQPLYLQLMQQIRHAVETGALQQGDQLPGIRTLAEDLVVSPTTVAKAYSELEHEGLLELRQGSGAFISVKRRGLSQMQRVHEASGQVESSSVICGRRDSRKMKSAGSSKRNCYIRLRC